MQEELRSLCGIMRNHTVITVVVTLYASCLGGCGSSMPVAVYSGFGDVANSCAIVLPPNAYAEPPSDGSVLVIMEPAADRFSRREGLSIQEFRSPTGSKGRVFIHYPKGTAEMRLVVYDVNKAGSEMIFKWKVAQNGQVVQSMVAKVLPGPPVGVFIDGHEIEVDCNNAVVDGNNSIRAASQPTSGPKTDVGEGSKK